MRCATLLALQGRLPGRAMLRGSQTVRTIHRALRSFNLLAGRHIRYSDADGDPQDQSTTHRNRARQKARQHKAQPNQWSNISSDGYRRSKIEEVKSLKAQKVWRGKYWMWSYSKSLLGGAQWKADACAYCFPSHDVIFDILDIYPESCNEVLSFRPIYFCVVVNLQCRYFHNLTFSSSRPAISSGFTMAKYEVGVCLLLKYLVWWYSVFVSCRRTTHRSQPHYNSTTLACMRMASGSAEQSPLSCELFWSLC